MAQYARNTMGDAIAVHLTGATTAGGVQADPALSLGRHRSSTVLAGQGWRLVAGLPVVRLIEVYGPPATGVGALRAVTQTSVAYTPPGGTEGPAVVLPVGEVKVVFGGGDAAGQGAYVVASRVAAVSMSGTMSFEIVDPLRTLFADTPATGTTGSTVEYRAVMLRARSRVGNVRLWRAVTPGVGDFAFGVEAPGASGAIQSIPTSDIAPGGVTFSTADSLGAAVVIGTIEADSNYGVWIRRAWVQGTDAAGAVPLGLNITFDAPLA